MTVNKQSAVVVQVYFSESNCVLSFLDSSKIKISKLDTKNNFCKLTTTATIINSLSKLPCVDFIDIFTEPTTEVLTIGYEKRAHGINKHLFQFPSVNGNNIVIGVKEKKIDPNDIDLQKRNVSSTLEDNQIDNHATTIATLIGGAGNSYHIGKGLAYRANFLSSTFNNLFPDDTIILKAASVSIQNHSYGTAVQNYYGPEARAYDEQLIRQPHFLHVFSSGNAGLLASSNGTYLGLTEYANCTGNFKMAKNVITVGAVDTGGTLLPFSSKGPLHDGRLAPQLVALGANGTSDAAALVSGTVALLQQLYKDSNNNQLPNAAIIKSILYNTANKKNLPAISYSAGYGRLNVNKAILSMQQKEYKTGVVGNGEEWTTIITVPNNVSKLTVTLNYTDTTASLNTSKALVNNLDLKITNSSTTFLPWVLNSASHVDSLKALPKRQTDTLNTTEQITIDYPAPGTYLVNIKGTSIATLQKQFFSIAYHLDTANSFTFLNPITADDINTNENPILPISWECNLLDNNTTGQLYIDHNNSGSWTLINGSVRLHNQIFYWQIPNFEGLIQFKIATPFGDFYTNKIALHIPTKVSLLYNCNDSARLVWPRHLLANSYNVYTLTDSAYLKKIATVTDSSFYFIKSALSSKIFAVEPVLQNGVHATRSEAINIDLQGVKCFYKQFLLQNMGAANLIQLELSYPQLVQKIIFEKINLDGSSRKIDSLLVNSTTAFYQVSDNHLTKGVNQYRAKIILQNGSFYFTEIISTTNTGKDYFILYPSIVNSGQNMQYLQKEFIENSNLYFYFTNGILYKKQTIGLNGTITTKDWQKGIYIYHYFNNKNNTRQIGKIIVL